LFPCPPTSRYAKVAAYHRPMPIYIVVAENYVKRAGRMEARWIGNVEADSIDSARRIAKGKWPRLTLTIHELDSQPPTTPKDVDGPNP
jgi:hypothetical protein